MPGDRIEQAFREQPDVEPRMSGIRTDLILADAQQVEQQRAEARVLEQTGHREAARAVAAAPAAVREED